MAFIFSRLPNKPNLNTATSTSFRIVIACCFNNCESTDDTNSTPAVS